MAWKRESTDIPLQWRSSKSSNTRERGSNRVNNLSPKFRRDLLQLGCGDLESGNWTPFCSRREEYRGGVCVCVSSPPRPQAAGADKAKSPPPSAVTLSKQSRC